MRLLVIALFALASLTLAGCGKPACNCSPCDKAHCCAACKGNGVMCNCNPCKCCDHCAGKK